MNGPLADPRIESVLQQLHQQDRKQFGAILRHYLPGVLKAIVTRRYDVDTTSPAEAAFPRDKLVARDRPSGFATAPRHRDRN